MVYLNIISWYEMPYNIIPQNIRAVFNYKVRKTFTWIMEKHKRLQGNVRCQFICDLYYPSFFLCHISLALPHRQSYWWRQKNLICSPDTQVACDWLLDERQNRWLPGRRSHRAAGRLADLWPGTSHASQNFLLDWIRLGMLRTPFCVNHNYTDAWTLLNMIKYCVYRRVGVDTLL